jgi:hypothetical protein
MTIQQREFTIEELEILKGLFEVVRSMVSLSGGDGEGWIISQRHIQIADLFESDERQQEKPWFTTVVPVGDARTLFQHGQEYICFAGDLKRVPSGAEIVVQLGLVL